VSYALSADAVSAPAVAPDVTPSGELATAMVLHGAVGTLIGAAAGPKGHEGLWGAAGFVMGAMLGQVGIVGIAFAALWQKGSAR